MNWTTIVARFLCCEGKLSPAGIAAANKLARSVVDPSRSNADACWAVIWDKPLYANIRVGTANRYVAALAPVMNHAWQTIGLPGGPFTVQGAKNEYRIVAGALPGQIKIAGSRLYAIQGAAQAVRERVAHRGKSPPYADLTQMSVEKAVKTVKKEMGLYWGHITTLHFLTDLNLACKPDLHLTRTVLWLGMVPPFQARKVPTEKESIEINIRVHELKESLRRVGQPREMRYLDKVLMEMSREKVIDDPYCLTAPPENDWGALLSEEAGLNGRPSRG